MITMTEPILPSREEFLNVLSPEEKSCYIKAEFYSVYPILLQLWRTPRKHSADVRGRLVRARETCLQSFINNME